LLAVGAVLANMAASAHRIGVEELGRHYDTSLFGPMLFLGGAVVCGVWPALREWWSTARRRRLSWLLAAVVIIVGAFAAGHIIEAASLSLVVSVAVNLSARRARTEPPRQIA
jgi:peptidoglycan/LPS O-acetylase OafA/YrhL